jgi:hypothetical protein
LEKEKTAGTRMATMKIQLQDMMSGSVTGQVAGFIF